MEIYKSGSIPLIVGADEELVQSVSTFWKYATGSCLMTKPLVGKSLNEGKPAAWGTFAAQARCAVGKETTLILHMENGACDLCGIAKEVHPEEGEITMRALFDPKEREIAKFA